MKNNQKLVSALGRLRSLDVAIFRHSEDLMYADAPIEKNEILKYFFEKSMHIELSSIYSDILDAFASGEGQDLLIDEIDSFAEKYLKEKFDITY